MPHVTSHAEIAPQTEQSPDDVALETGPCRGGQGTFYLTIVVHAVLMLLYGQLWQRTPAKVPEAASTASTIAQATSTAVPSTTKRHVKQRRRKHGHANNATD
jgi:hypothetical protein